METVTNEAAVDCGGAYASINILHLIIDHQFFDFIYKDFQEVEGVENRYVALVGTRVQHFNHIGHIPLWRIAGAEYVNSPQVTEDLEWCDVLLVHWWHSAAASVVAKAPDSVIVVWSGWGGDYYDLLSGEEASLYGDKTKQLLQQMQLQQTVAAHKKWIHNSLHRIKKIVKCTLGRAKDRDSVDKNLLINRFDYFSAPIPDDYRLLKRALGTKFRAKYIQLNYGSVEEEFMPGQCDISGNDILLGNSATGTNNHLEIINLLSSIDIEDRKVIVPLSYGSQSYGDEIDKCGRKLLGNHFVPIRNLMSLEQYNALISSCSIAIMNHRRQQALGNIGTMLYRGAKVFLDEKGVVYKFFKRKGACVFSVHEIAERGSAAFTPLSKSEKERNIEVLNQIWGHDTVIDNVHKFADRMRKCLATHA